MTFPAIYDGFMKDFPSAQPWQPWITGWFSASSDPKTQQDAPCGGSVSGVATDAPFASTISGKGPGNTLEVVQKWDDPKIIFFFVNHNIHHRDVPETSLLAQLILFFVVDHVQL